MLKALVQLTLGRWREFVREPSACFFVVFMPIMWMGILGAAFDHPRPVRVAVGWQAGANGDAASVVRDALARDPDVRLIEGEPAALATALRRGDAQLIVEPREAEPWRYVFDPANREAGRARLQIDALVQRAAGRVDPVATHDEPTEVPGTRYVDFLVPGLVALSIMTSSLFGTGAVVVVSRREHLLKRYLATPLRPSLYIASHILGRLFILAVELTTTLAFARVAFGVRSAGSLGAVVAVAVLGAMAFTALAMACASRTSNMAVMNGLTNLVTVPMMLVAGVWFGRGGFPPWLARLAEAMPLTALVDAMRRVILEGADLVAIGPQLGVLAAYLVVGAVSARVLFKWF